MDDKWEGELKDGEAEIGGLVELLLECLEVYRAHPPEPTWPDTYQALCSMGINNSASQRIKDTCGSCGVPCADGYWDQH